MTSSANTVMGTRPAVGARSFFYCEDCFRRAVDGVRAQRGFHGLFHDFQALAEDEPIVLSVANVAQAEDGRMRPLLHHRVGHIEPK
jgi:hypothetical protein